MRKLLTGLSLLSRVRVVRVVDLDITFAYNPVCEIVVDLDSLQPRVRVLLKLWTWVVRVFFLE